MKVVVKKDNLFEVVVNDNEPIVSKDFLVDYFLSIEKIGIILKVRGKKGNFQDVVFLVLIHSKDIEGVFKIQNS